MPAKASLPTERSRAFRSYLGTVLILFALGSGSVAFAQNGSAFFLPNNLLLSRVVYDNDPNNVVVGSLLPPNCAPANCVAATNNGAYPQVFNNALVDGSFGVTAKIFLDQLTPSGIAINSLEVPNSSQNGVPPTKDQTVTSFSSKSELALNLSTDNQAVTFMGYLAPINALDVSNANTPAVVDPTNPVPGQNYRVVAQVNAKGQFRFTKTNAYSGNNGRAAILNAADGVLYAAGNAGNGGNPQPDGIILGALRYRPYRLRMPRFVLCYGPRAHQSRPPGRGARPFPYQLSGNPAPGPGFSPPRLESPDFPRVGRHSSKSPARKT